MACPAGTRGGQGRQRGPPQSFLRWSVILHSCSFLAARGGGVHAAQSSAGQQGEKEKQQAARGAGQGGVDGHRGGSWGKARPCLWLSWRGISSPAPLPGPSPHTPRPTHSPWSQGYLLGSLKQGVCHITQCCRNMKDGQALPEDRAGRGGAGGLPRTRGGEGEDPSPRSCPPAKAWKGGAPGDSCFLVGAGWSPSPPLCGPRALQVTRILCFGTMLGQGVKARIRGRERCD